MKVDKPKKKVGRKKKILLFLIGIFMIGMIAGSFLIVILSNSDKALVKDYLQSFMKSVTMGKLNYRQAFTGSLISSIGSVLAIWLLGISVIGLPIIIFLYFGKAFLLGFSVSSMIYEYQAKGCLLALFYIFPHHILNFFIYTFLMVYATMLSLQMIKCIVYKKALDFKVVMRKYGVVLCICLVGAVITSLSETFLMPFLLEWILSVIA